MPKIRIKKGDTVQLISGRSQANGGDRGKTGKVIAVYPETERVLVEGINRIKRHTKEGSSGRGTKTGGIITQEAPIHISNVMVLAGDKPTRIGYRLETVERPDGRTKTNRIRVARKTGKDL
jgi:large subunit ribosomal protein L24